MASFPVEKTSVGRLAQTKVNKKRVVTVKAGADIIALGTVIMR